MKVSRLISLLRKMPQNLDVYYSHGDNSEFELAGECGQVVLLAKSDIDTEFVKSREDQDAFNRLPAKCVVIRG